MNDYTNNHSTSYYAERLNSFNELLSNCNSHSHYMQVIELLSKYFIEDLYGIACVNKLHILEVKTIINMIQQIKENEFDKAEMSFTILKNFGSKILEYFEDNKLGLWVQNTNTGKVRRVKGDGGVYMSGNAVKFNIDVMECLLHKAYSMELNK